MGKVQDSWWKKSQAVSVVYEHVAGLIEVRKKFPKKVTSKAGSKLYIFARYRFVSRRISSTLWLLLRQTLNWRICRQVGMWMLCSLRILTY